MIVEVVIKSLFILIVAVAGIAPVITWIERKQSAVRMMDSKQLQARFAQPADIANLVLFLASDESRFVNGAEYRIDNGYLMWAD